LEWTKGRTDVKHRGENRRKMRMTKKALAATEYILNNGLLWKLKYKTTDRPLLRTSFWNGQWTKLMYQSEGKTEDRRG
jgi:hypothetical protein